MSQKRDLGIRHPPAHRDKTMNGAQLLMVQSDYSELMNGPPAGPCGRRDVKTIQITLAQFQEFCELQQKRRWNWPATFSTNSRGEIWPYLRKGLTPSCERENVRSVSPLLAIVADIYSTQREKGGRFFINELGAFWKLCSEEWIQFVKWDAGGERLLTPMQVKSEELARSFFLTPDQLKQMMQERLAKKNRH